MFNCRLIVILLISLLFTPMVQAAERTGGGDAVIAAIDAAVESLKKEPNQFTLNVINVGVMGTGSNGGTGINANAQGGGVGSTTIGVQGIANGGNIQITKAAADERMILEAQKATRVLQDIRSMLVKKKINKPEVKSKLAEFSATYVAPVLKETIAALIKKWLHL